MESYLVVLSDRKRSTLFLVFSIFLRKNSAKAKETSGSWLKVFSETPKNASILLHFATVLHKKKNMFSVEPK